MKIKSIFRCYPLIASIGLLLSYNYTFAQEHINNRELNNGEILSYKTRPESNPQFYAGWYTRGSYDLTRYKVEIDTQGKIIASNLRGCYLKHQGEVYIFHSTGNVSRVGDTTKVLAKTIYSKFYVIGLKENGVVDSFSSEIKIDILSQTLKGKYSPNLVTINSQLSITALPSKVKKKEIYKATHPDQTVGEFTYFSIIDSKGKSLLLPQGDYVVLGGNSLTIPN